LSASRGTHGVLRTALVLCAALSLVAPLAACRSKPLDLEAQRKLDEEFLATNAEDLFVAHPSGFAAVQGGESAGSAPTADEAAELAESKAAGRTLHRFVFRKDDAGERLHRMAFLPAGGLVAGRAFLAQLGFRVVSAGGTGAARTLVVERMGLLTTIDLAAHPRLRLELGPVAGPHDLVLDVPLDPDFDGPLLLPMELAKDLRLELAEIPGKAEVQVALGRPFAARRSWATANCPGLYATQLVEVLVEAPGPGAGKR
jgi:hypothetical protein